MKQGFSQVVRERLHVRHAWNKLVSFFYSPGYCWSQRRSRPCWTPRCPSEYRKWSTWWPSLPASPSFLPCHLLLTSLCSLQGPPATMIEPLPIREGRRKRHRHSNGAGGAAPFREEEEDVDLEEFLQRDQPMEEPEGMEEVFATLSSMKTEIEVMRRPLGSFESPARTCKELMMVQPDYKDGEQRQCFLIDYFNTVNVLSRKN